MDRLIDRERTCQALILQGTQFNAIISITYSLDMTFYFCGFILRFALRPPSFRPETPPVANHWPKWLTHILKLLHLTQQNTYHVASATYHACWLPSSQIWSWWAQLCFAFATSPLFIWHPSFVLTLNDQQQPLTKRSCCCCSSSLFIVNSYF